MEEEQSVEERHVDSVSMKVVMLGDSGVGKTSLVSMWSTHHFNDGQTPTVCAMSSVYGVNIDGRAADVFLWDTAGQEQFSPLTPLYLRQTSVAILTAAIDNAETFESIDKWLQLVHETCDGGPPVILAINKMDLKGDDCIVPDLREDADEVFAGVFYVSAKTGENVQELFEFACRKGCQYVIAEKEVRSKSRNIAQPSMFSGCC